MPDSLPENCRQQNSRCAGRQPEELHSTIHAHMQRWPDQVPCVIEYAIKRAEAVTVGVRYGCFQTWQINLKE